MTAFQRRPRRDRGLRLNRPESASADRWDAFVARHTIAHDSLHSVEQLGETIADLAARIHAATYELLVMLVARALPGLPRLSGALKRGEISYAKVRALTRVATFDNEARLLELAYHATAGQVERVARAWRRCDRMEEARETERRNLTRSVTTYVDEDGMVILRARLTPEQGAVVQRALEAASEKLYQENRKAAAPDSISEEVTFSQRRADASTGPRAGRPRSTT